MYFTSSGEMFTFFCLLTAYILVFIILDWYFYTFIREGFNKKYGFIHIWVGGSGWGQYP